MQSQDWKNGYRDGYEGCACYERQNAQYMHGWQCGHDAAEAMRRNDSTIFGRSWDQIQRMQQRSR